MVEGIRLVKFPKKIRDKTSQKNPTSLIKKTVCSYPFEKFAMLEILNF